MSKAHRSKTAPDEPPADPMEIITLLNQVPAGANALISGPMLGAEIPDGFEHITATITSDTDATRTAVGRGTTSVQALRRAISAYISLPPTSD